MQNQQLLFRKRFIQELLTKKIIEELFNEKNIFTQKLEIEHTFTRGSLVRLSFFLLKNLKPRYVRKNLNLSLTLLHSKQKIIKANNRFKFKGSHRIRLKNYTNKSFLKNDLTKALFRNNLDWKSNFIVTYTPLSNLITNTKILALLDTSQRALYKFRTHPSFWSILLLTVLNIVLPGWLTPLIKTFSRDLHRSRRQSQKLKLFKAVLMNVTKKRGHFANFKGLLFQYKGRIDKRPRKLFKTAFFGKLARQQIEGKVTTRKELIVTKNGILSIKMSSRFLS